MFFSLYPHARRLQRLLERLLVSGLLATTLVLVTLALLFLLRTSYPHGTALWLVAAALTLLRLVQLYQARRRLQQISLEAHLLQQPLTADTLATCLQRQDHLWAQSAVLQGLRAAHAQPSPGRLRPDEHLRQFHTLFSDHLGALRPPLLRPNLLVVGVLLALWIFDAEPGAVLLRYGLALLGVLLGVELIESRLAWKAQDALDGLALGLSTWALDQPAPAPPRPHPYHHERLYLDRPLTASEPRGT